MNAGGWGGDTVQRETELRSPSCFPPSPPAPGRPPPSLLPFPEATLLPVPIRARTGPLLLRPPLSSLSQRTAHPALQNIPDAQAKAWLREGAR